MSDLKLGLIGAGNISASYLGRAPHFAGIRFVAVADMNHVAAEARATEYGIEARSVDALLASPDIDLIVNLTIPAAHFDISKRALEAGKHVYSEKPYVLTLEEGRELARIAAERGLRIGSAPDTFLGTSHQLARHIVDSGAIGRVTSGTCAVMSSGMESWHPNPDFFFLKGGGPVLDLGPYYISNLVQLLGPVARVAALASTPSPTRTIGSAARKGEQIPVETPTTIHALLEFEGGAVISFQSSWDVHQHDLKPMALYGTEGTLHIPDPNFFDGEVRVTRRAEAADLPAWDHPLGPPNRETNNGKSVADYRASGLADMALAIAEGRPHRCNDELALHVVEVMTAILQSGEEGRFVPMTTTCARPEALDPAAAAQLLASQTVPA
ncbi:Gfo/Idh/MocA family protein [Paracoccus sp. AK26]|uniref:Gfo/Idh/MocA family protein n=1 Tax=Paracoccus sp. AK26 TaxID=2589076 RepID=UPI001428106F|nr:Gfo/Idh/MocA family oxidoreductase [Paracoccus sp. AK26]QIR86529.1 Gfo/Idh/MocA family oxidoreductase [Paracoccus sp. AK26]